ncbi:hypothetical protein KUCAC02_005866 [Chaenocephalus aceratus]|uniref:Uncharacterized protein n=1 Tax=Chaenocephalus aceratus TaxID=36190 RepID=A0ACB9WRD3_CHAAC|nr:hypothetical protein KUCAC02_005866 [Chaenocephalus aceratus]
MERSRRHTSPLRPSDLCSTKTRQFPPSSCTVSPGSVSRRRCSKLFPDCTTNRRRRERSRMCCPMLPSPRLAILVGRQTSVNPVQLLIEFGFIFRRKLKLSQLLTVHQLRATTAAPWWLLLSAFVVLTILILAMAVYLHCTADREKTNHPVTNPD